MKGRYGFAATYLGLGLLLAACNGGTDSGTPPTTAELIGKWLLREVATKGEITMKFPPLVDTSTKIDTVETYTGSDNYMTFKTDNTYEANMPETDPPDGGIDAAKRAVPRMAPLETGTWALAGSDLTLITDATTENPYKDTIAMKVSLSGTTLKTHLHMDTSSSEGGFTYSTKMDIKATLVK